MSSTIIEQTRVLHEDIERYQKLVVKELQNKAKNTRKIIYQNHRINECLVQMQDRSSKLLKIYNDEDGMRKEEIESMGGSNLQRMLSSFDMRLSEIREYHRKFPDAVIERRDDLTIDDLIDFKYEFSGEESYGRFVDLHSFHNRYNNMKQFGAGKPEKAIDYSSYLNTFYLFHTIKVADKNDEYKRYLQDLYDYLESFYKRTQPLSDITSILEWTEEEFAQNWGRGKVIGWEDVSHQYHQTDSTSSSAAVGNGENGTKGKKGKKGKKSRNKEAFYRSIALLEAKISRFCEVLGDVLDATKIEVEKKQSRTWQEIEAEHRRAEEELYEEEYKPTEDQDEDKDMINTNPLNLPLNWDGKPIPYWLYRLHGLGIEYKCEICGNHSYWGPRVFERHFQDWRHAHGMRCLRIPNTRHFHHITSIQDARDLWEKIKKESGTKSWKAEAEEFEDSEGNVLNKKTYEDLKRQGLL